MNGEGITEYEQALRTLYREAWPHADEATKDSTLKRKLEDGLSSGEMLRFLRLHARTDDFAQTVAKARRFAETQQAIKPKKAVRIAEAVDKDHNSDAVQPGQPKFQPLLDGIQQVIQTILQDKAQIASVTSVPSENDKSKRGGALAVRCCRRQAIDQMVTEINKEEKMIVNNPDHDTRVNRKVLLLLV